MNHSKPPVNVDEDAASWQTAKRIMPGVIHEVIVWLEVGDRAADALFGNCADDTLNGGHP